MTKKVWILHHATGINGYENTQLLDRLGKAGIEGHVLEPKFFDIIVSRGSTRSIRYKGERIDMPNLVLSRTGSGTNYFTLALMRQIEKFNIPVINDADSVSVVSDKLLTSQILTKENLPIPKTILVNGDVDIDLVEKEIGFPCVVKATSGSKGKTVHLCESKKEFAGLMALLSSIALKKILIIQEFIDSAPGTDLRVWVIGGKTIVAMKRTSGDGDFRANISQGGSGENFIISEEIDYLARETARSLGLQIAGIDLLFDKEGYKICEANSSPGFEGMDQYCGQDMAQRIVDFIKLKIQ
jgi:glutathione synthase/RimK-type ligase-like ATP-grasp enzyme